MHPSGYSAPPPMRPPSVAGVRTVFTYGILAVTILVFVGQWGFGAAFTVYGLKINQLIRQGEYWRFVTPIFFHADPMHLFFNMYALYNIGTQIERLLGRVRFLMIYFFSGIAGVAASFLFNPAPSLGASGAIFGLIGALAVFLYRNTKILGPVGRSMLTNVLVVIGMNLAISFHPQIDLWGHLGGLLAGAGLTWVLGQRLTLDFDLYTGSPVVVDRNPLSRRLPAAFIILALGFLAALWLLVR
ncbi:MAG: rhomboid family intramembrane serine protease [Anaerolineales bacterium]|nr:rhomboid family intramembrane serine protease [Anaerolineales bacterium]